MRSVGGHIRVDESLETLSKYATFSELESEMYPRNTVSPANYTAAAVLTQDNMMIIAYIYYVQSRKDSCSLSSITQYNIE